MQPNKTIIYVKQRGHSFWHFVEVFYIIYTVNILNRPPFVAKRRQKVELEAVMYSLIYSGQLRATGKMHSLNI